MARQTEAKQQRPEQPPFDVSPPKNGSDAGWESIGEALPEAVGFLKKSDLAEGAVIEARLNGAFLIPDEGKYRVIYSLTLRRAVGDYEADDVVNLGEKFKLRALRNVPVGSLVRLTVGETKDLDGGRTMVSFDVKVKPAKGATCGELLARTWKSAAASDPWNTGPGIGATDEAPF